MGNKMRLILLLPLLPLCGCASLSPGDLHVLDRNRAYKQTDVVDLLYKAPVTTVRNGTDVVLLHPVKVNMNSIATSGSSKSMAKKFAERLEMSLASDISRKTPLSLATPGESIPSGLEAAALSVVVTEFDPGNGFARWFIGAGAGATSVQIEGDLKDSHGTVIMAFADRRMHSGNPTLGLNLAAISDEYTLTALRREFVDALIQLLQSQ